MPDRISIFDPEAVARPDDMTAGEFLGLLWKATGHVTPAPISVGSSTWDITDEGVGERTFPVPVGCLLYTSDAADE